MNKDAHRIVAANVKRLREQKEISVPEAAAKIGVHRSWWNLLESGRLNFTIDKLDKVATLLGVSAAYLMVAQSSAPKRKRDPHAPLGAREGKRRAS